MDSINIPQKITETDVFASFPDIFLPDSITKDTTSLVTFYMLHLLIVVYQPPPCIEYILQHRRLVAICVQTFYNSAVF